jgi:hypothetical protein
MRNHPCFLECGADCSSTGRGVAGDRYAEPLPAKQARGPPPERAVHLELPVKDGLRFGPEVDFDSNCVKVLAHSNQRKEVGHDVKLTGRELLSQLPVGQAALQIEVLERGDRHPRLDDGELVLESTARDTPDFDTPPSEVLLPDRAEAIDVLGSALRRQDAQVPGVEESPEPDGGGVVPHPGEGVADEIRGARQTEPRERVQNRLVARGELNDDALPAAVARLATGRVAHGRNGFLTGKPQIPQGT